MVKGAGEITQRVTPLYLVARVAADGDPDTAQVMFEFPGEVAFNFDATIASSFDASYELFHGSDSSVMIRDNKAWMFKEVDAPLLGWEVYAKSGLNRARALTYKTAFKLCHY